MDFYSKLNVMIDLVLSAYIYGCIWRCKHKFISVWYFL